MTFPALDIPDKTAQMAGWLETHIVGLELGELAAGFEAVRNADSATVSLEEACGGRLIDVLESGLSALSHEQLCRLLTQPTLLMELQERVFRDGGPFWRTRTFAHDHQQFIDTGWPSIQKRIRENATTAATGAPATDAPDVIKPQHWFRHPAFIVLATAAVVVVAVIVVTVPKQRPLDVVDGHQTPAPAWGWDRQGALTVKLPAPEYLNHLAKAAGEWFKKTPQTPDDLKKRLGQYRHACDTLIEAPHPQLAAADRKWLVEKCRAWAKKIDGHIAALDKNENVEIVRKAADETINKLIKAIKARAIKIG